MTTTAPILGSNGDLSALRAAQDSRSDKVLREMVRDRRNLLDMVRAFRDPVHVDLVRSVAGMYAERADPWGWVWLCSGVPWQRTDPIEWMPDPNDYAYLRLMVDFLHDIPSSVPDARDMVEFPLRLAVDRLLMSGAFHGCGMETVKECASSAFYGLLLAADEHSRPGKPPEIRRALCIIGAVARTFERLGLPRLSLCIGSALSYYGRDDLMSDAQDRLVGWMLSQGIHPSLLDLVLADFLMPTGGRLLPNVEKLLACRGKARIPHVGMCGAIDLAPAVNALSGCVLEGKAPQTAIARSLLCAYLEWHARWGLTDG